MPNAPLESGDHSPRPLDAPALSETEAAASLAMVERRFETVMQLIGDAEVADAVRTTSSDLERALLRYARVRQARAMPAAAADVHRVFDAIEAERGASL